MKYQENMTVACDKLEEPVLPRLREAEERIQGIFKVLDDIMMKLASLEERLGS